MVKLFLLKPKINFKNCEWHSDWKSIKFIKPGIGIRATKFPVPLRSFESSGTVCPKDYIEFDTMGIVLKINLLWKSLITNRTF